MFYLTRIAATAPSGVSRMTRHLMNATLSVERNIEALRLAQGESLDLKWLELAQAVNDGTLTYSEAMADLIPPWKHILTLEEPNLIARMDAVSLRYETRFLALMDQLEQGTAGAPLAVLRPDTEAGVLRQLGILPGMLLTEDNVNGLLAGRRADGEKIVGKSYAVYRTKSDGSVSLPTGSFDFCAMAPKSFSVAWAFSTPVEQARLMDIFTRAAREGAAYLADEIGVARFGKDGCEEEQGAVTWLEFTHHTARRVQILPSDIDGAAEVRDSGKPGDPSIHTHFLFPNAVFCSDGRVGGISTWKIDGLRREAGQFMQARLNTLLHEAGYDRAVDPKHMARMAVIPEYVEQGFSKRRNYAETLAKQYTEKQGEVWADLDPAQQKARIHSAITNLDQMRGADGKGNADDKADFVDWRKQATQLGWEPPKSFELIGPQTRDLSNAERYQGAYEIAIRHLEPKFAQKSVLSHYELRFAALVGLTHLGVDRRKSERIVDVDAVTKLMREQGVLQYGEKTPLVWGKEADGSVSVTTGLHVEQEKELIVRIQFAHADTSGRLDPRLFQHHVKASGLDFGDDHGRNTLRAVTKAATGSRFELVEAAAGAGKTTAASVLVAARRGQGWQIHGASLAWQQADDLVHAGINRRAVHAFSVLMTKLEDGSLRLNPRSLLVIDEYGLLGTRQLLQLMRYQNRDGFSVFALGDSKQLSSVEAGDSLRLTKTALGIANVPSIETTRRQQGREAEIASLLRQGKAKEAIAMKRDDGTAILAPNGKAGTVRATVDLYMQRLAVTGKAPTISVPTNKEAHRINLALREAKQAAGLVKPDAAHKKATDGRDEYVMALAPGDRVRLLKSTGGSYYDPATGKTSGGSVGRNGTALTVLGVNDGGLLVQASKDRVATIDWASLADPKTGRILLAYGDAGTMHRSQGSTSGEHIWVLTEGSTSISGAAGYSAATRHTDKSWLITNADAETLSVKKERAVNDPAPVTDDERWAYVARRLAWRPEKDTATAMQERIGSLQRGTVDLLHHVTTSNIMLSQPDRGRAAEVVQARKLDMAWTIAQRTIKAIKHTGFERD